MKKCGCTATTWCAACYALAQKAGILDKPRLSEKAFLSAVIRVAQGYGWYAYHTNDSRRSLPGYPDLTLCHPAGKTPLVFAELKVPGGILTLQQRAWLDALTLGEGKEVHVWTPDQMPLIDALLRKTA